MRIVVVGAGALGGLVGARLTEAGEDVILLEINPARVKLLNEAGLFVAEGNQDERRVRVKVVGSVGEIDGEADLVFVSVKSYQTEVALRGVLPIIGERTYVLSMQNGIGNPEKMATIIGAERVLGGITYHSIQHTGPNRLRYRVGIKPIQIAPLSGELTPVLETIGAVFQRAGLATNVVENIDHAVWHKLLHNAVVNPVSAVTGLNCHELLQDEDCQWFMRELCYEIVAVMRARGIPIIDEEDPYRPVIASQRSLGKNRPSMWQDLARGVPTEVDAINGVIVEEAKRHGLSATLNFGLVRFIHSRENQILPRKRRAQRTAEAAQKKARASVRATERGEQGGMPRGRIPLDCTPRLKEMLVDYYRDLDAAGRDPARRVAWVSGFGPVEIVRALGLTPYFPENHAALIGASGQANRYIRRAVAEGFSSLVSTETTCDIGAALTGESPLVTAYGLAGPPRPDVLVYNTSYGQTLARWFEYHATVSGAPLLGLHPPAMLGELERIEIDAAAKQLVRLSEELERLVGRKIDYDRLAEVMELSRRAGDLYSEVLRLACNVPSPLTYFDTLIHLAPMVLMRGSPQAVAYYEILLDELRERVADKVAAVPGERFRLFWEGPPIWCALRPLSNLFFAHQVAVVASTYAGIFASVRRFDTAAPMESMARVYTGVFPNRSREFKVSYLAQLFGEYGVDGVVYHDARTSPEHSSVRHGIHIRMQRETGLPSLVVEADSHDLRLFSRSAVERRLEDFIEQAHQRRGSRDDAGTRQEAP